MSEATATHAPASRIAEIEFEEVSDLPKQKRAGGGNITPKQPFPWEHALTPVRENGGKWHKVLTFGEGDSAMRSARTKAAGVSRYLWNATPHHDYSIRARENVGVWGLYVRFNGERDEAKIKEVAALKQERADRITARLAKS